MATDGFNQPWQMVYCVPSVPPSVIKCTFDDHQFHSLSVFLYLKLHYSKQSASFPLQVIFQLYESDSCNIKVFGKPVFTDTALATRL
jgi:hypothetical protein